jgi:hypothetical protein
MPEFERLWLGMLDDSTRDSEDPVR